MKTVINNSDLSKSRVIYQLLEKELTERGIVSTLVPIIMTHPNVDNALAAVLGIDITYNGPKEFTTDKGVRVVITEHRPFDQAYQEYGITTYTPFEGYFSSESQAKDYAEGYGRTFKTEESPEYPRYFKGEREYTTSVSYYTLMSDYVAHMSVESAMATIDKILIVD